MYRWSEKEILFCSKHVYAKKSDTNLAFTRMLKWQFSIFQIETLILLLNTKPICKPGRIFILLPPLPTNWVLRESRHKMPGHAEIIGLCLLCLFVCVCLTTNLNFTKNCTNCPENNWATSRGSCKKFESAKLDRFTAGPVWFQSWLKEYAPFARRYLRKKIGFDFVFAFVFFSNLKDYV